MRTAYWDTADPEMHFGNPNLRRGSPSYLLKPGNPGWPPAAGTDRRAVPAGAFPVLAGGTGKPCPPETGKRGPGDAAARHPHQTRPCRHGWEKCKIGVDGKWKAEMMKPNPNMKTLWGRLLGLGAQPVITNPPASQLVFYGSTALLPDENAGGRNDKSGLNAILKLKHST